jgi:predicted RNA-binding protein with EMAP domain
MNIIEKESEDFYEYGFLNSGIHQDLENIKSSLTSKLYNFNRDRDKLDFLKILRVKAIEDKEEHMKSCSGCGYDKARDIAVFAIDQEVDDINRYYSYEPKSDDEFSTEQEADLHNKLNNILEKLEKQGFGQQIIFEEIEDLKNHFNLGKKNWFQLLKGKVVDLTLKKVLDKTIVQEIYNQLSEGFEQAIKMIE